MTSQNNWGTFASQLPPLIRNLPIPVLPGLNQPIEVFFSYSSEDERMREKLENHLRNLERQGVITSWHKRKIGAGEEWEQQIDEHLNTARIILLLVSSSFIASDYCYDIELQRAMKRHYAGDARVIPIKLSPVDMEGAPFSKLQFLPSNGRAVTEWRPYDRAFENITQGIRAAITEQKKAQQSRLLTLIVVSIALPLLAGIGSFSLVSNLQSNSQQNQVSPEPTVSPLIP